MLSPTQRILFIPAILLLINGCSSEPAQEKPSGHRLVVPVQPVQPGNCLSEINISGKVVPATALIVFKNSGRLEKGQIALRQGMTFSEGQLLCQINNKDAYSELTAIKTEVINALTALMPEINRTLPHKAIDKWKAFLEALKPVALLPDYPTTNFPEEKAITQLDQLRATYRKAQQLESGMKGYFYVAPFTGSVSKVFIEEDETVKAGATVAELSGSGAMQLEVTLTKEQLQQIKKGKTYQLMNKNGRSAGKAVFSHSAAGKNGMTTCTFAIQPEKGIQPAAGTTLSIQLQGKSDQPCIIVDADQVCHDAVQIVQNGKIVTIPVKVIGRDGQRLRITGLSSDQAILLDAYETAPKDIRFVPARK